MEALANAAWPGNVRELQNCIECAVILTRDEELEVPIADLGSSSEAGFSAASGSSFRQAECSVIVEALEPHRYE